MGSANTHRGIAGHLAKLSGCDVLVPDYELAPGTVSRRARRCRSRISGLDQPESAPAPLPWPEIPAGGGLSVVLAMRLQDHGHPLPSSVTCFSPWTDL